MVAVRSSLVADSTAAAVGYGQQLEIDGYVVFPNFVCGGSVAALRDNANAIAGNEMMGVYAILPPSLL